MHTEKHFKTCCWCARLPSEDPKITHLCLCKVKVLNVYFLCVHANAVVDARLTPRKQSFSGHIMDVYLCAARRTSIRGGVS